MNLTLSDESGICLVQPDVVAIPIPIVVIGGKERKRIIAAKLVSREQVVKLIPCGPDPEKHLNGIREYIRAGFDRIFVHQIGPHQLRFMEFYAKEILPRIRELSERALEAA